MGEQNLRDTYNYGPEGPGDMGPMPIKEEPEDIYAGVFKKGDVVYYEFENGLYEPGIFKARSNHDTAWVDFAVSQHFPDVKEGLREVTIGENRQREVKMALLISEEEMHQVLREQSTPVDDRMTFMP